MEEVNTKIAKFFDILDFSSEEKLIYFALIKSKELTVLGVSKQTGIERTKVYRVTEKMLEKGLIFERIDFKKRYFQPSGINTIEQIAKEKIEKAEEIKTQLPSFLQELSSFQEKTSPTNVKYYYGTSGIKQVLWNELKAEKEVLSYSYRNLQEIAGKKYFYLWEKEFENRGLIMKDLRSKEFMESSKNLKPMPFKNDIKRYIDPKVLNIVTEIDIYNNIVVVFNWFEGDIFAIEIENDKLATMHKQMFNVFWNMAKPLEID